MRSWRGEKEGGIYVNKVLKYEVLNKNLKKINVLGWGNE